MTKIGVDLPKLS